MAKTAMIRARTDPGIKAHVERIFHSLGLTSTEAINLFFLQVKLHKGIPFEVKVPNRTTLRAMKLAGRKKGLADEKRASEVVFVRTGSHSDLFE